MRYELYTYASYLNLKKKIADKAQGLDVDADVTDLVYVRAQHVKQKPA